MAGACVCTYECFVFPYFIIYTICNLGSEYVYIFIYLFIVITLSYLFFFLFYIYIIFSSLYEF